MCASLERFVKPIVVKKSAPPSVWGVPMGSSPNKLGAVVVDSLSSNLIALVASDPTLALTSDGGPSIPLPAASRVSSSSTSPPSSSSSDSRLGSTKETTGSCNLMSVRSSSWGILEASVCFLRLITASATRVAIPVLEKPSRVTSSSREFAWNRLNNAFQPAPTSPPRDLTSSAFFSVKVCNEPSSMAE